MGELALVGNHSTVPLTQISCNTVPKWNQNARKAGTLCNKYFKGLFVKYRFGQEKIRSGAPDVYIFTIYFYLKAKHVQGGGGGDHPIGSNGPARQKEHCCLLLLAYYESSYYLTSVSHFKNCKYQWAFPNEVHILGHMHSPIYSK